MPSEMMRNDPLLDTEPNATDTQWRYEWPGAKTNVKTEQKSDPFYFNATTPMRDTDAPPNADATYTPMRDPDAVPYSAADRAASEDEYYDRDITLRTSKFVERGKSRKLNGESFRGVGESDMEKEDRDNARKGIDPDAPRSPINVDRPPGPKYTANHRPPHNEEDMGDYVEFEPVFRPGDSVPQDYAFNTPPTPQPPIDDNMGESESPFGPNPNLRPVVDFNAAYFDREETRPTGLNRKTDMFSHGEDAVYVKFDPLRGLEKRQVKGLEVLQPHRRMASDRQANPPFKWSQVVIKDRRASNFRTLRGGYHPPTDYDMD